MMMMMKIIEDNWPLICWRSIFVLATDNRRWILLVVVLSGLKSTQRNVDGVAPARDGTNHKLHHCTYKTTLCRVYTWYMLPEYKLYPLVSPSTCILYRRQNCRHCYMYRFVSASRTLLRTCIRLHDIVPGVNVAALKPRLHQIQCSRIQVSRTSNLYPDTSGYNLYPGYMYQV